ncbi:hypothetical protein CAPTEDRAFT_209539 [Capitella teleta]|uniref:Lbx homeodomain protein n=1 Tax=Capitella teleta TaxID=283909 RepID=R7UJ70_CAPTE|nr:hypothetical protein CAPTEDRAFT_209539 [Capitella teleta]|eukprot:ELU03843.1 hypothetical protein CAPTEDRAFT_209539 [Capitella teleta]
MHRAPPRGLSPPPSGRSPAAPSSAPGPRYESLQRLALVQLHPPRNPNKPLTPFSITDILDGRAQPSRSSPTSLSHSPPSRRTPYDGRLPVRPVPQTPPKTFLRPWATSSPEGRTEDEMDDDDLEDEEIEVDDEKPPKSSSKTSPLDALFQMTSKTFDSRDGRLHPLDGLLVKL